VSTIVSLIRMGRSTFPAPVRVRAWASFGLLILVVVAALGVVAAFVGITAGGDLFGFAMAMGLVVFLLPAVPFVIVLNALFVRLARHAVADLPRELYLLASACILLVYLVAPFGVLLLSTPILAPLFVAVFALPAFALYKSLARHKRTHPLPMALGALGLMSSLTAGLGYAQALLVAFAIDRVGGS
jgi:hypothetical protein